MLSTLSKTINNHFLFQCEPGLGASVMYNLLYNEPTKLMLLAGCSTVCTTVAEAAKMWNLVVVSNLKIINCVSIFYKIYLITIVFPQNLTLKIPNNRPRSLGIGIVVPCRCF